jgi:hypothetical protein
VAHAATEYLYRLDGVEDVSVRVEGSVAVVEIPSIAATARRAEQAGLGFGPQRVMYDAASGRITLVDVARKKMHAATREEMVATKKQFLQRYWESLRDKLATLPPDQRADVQRTFAEKLAHPAAVTTFGRATGTRPSGIGVDCDELPYDDDGKPVGTVCVVSFAALKKRPNAQSSVREAESVFAVLAATELFQIQVDTAVAPGLVAELATAPGANAHSLRLVRVRKVADRKDLVDTTGFTELIPR